MELEDRVRLLGQIQTFSGLVLVTAPPFNGAYSTAYSLMSFLVRGGRDVLSLETQTQWPIEGARQVEVADAAEMEETLRSMVAVRPEALVAETYDILPTIAAPQGTSINAVAATPDMRWVFTGGSDGYIRKYNWLDTVNGKKCQIYTSAASTRAYTRCGWLGATAMPMRPGFAGRPWLSCVQCSPPSIDL